MSNEFTNKRFKNIDIEKKGTTLIINGSESLKEVDYTDITSVKIMATNAVHTANGLYELIKKNCNTKNPDLSPKTHLEMYLSLAALSCEIYMKSIIYNENRHKGGCVKGHYLKDLFKKLPDTHKNKIKSSINDFNKGLSRINKLFDTLRYDFEQNNINVDFNTLFNFMEELHNIANIYPKHTCGFIRSANRHLFVG